MQNTSAIPYLYGTRVDPHVTWVPPSHFTRSAVGVASAALEGMNDRPVSTPAPRVRGCVGAYSSVDRAGTCKYSMFDS